MANNAESTNKLREYNDSERVQGHVNKTVQGSVDGASKMKPVIGNRKRLPARKRKNSNVKRQRVDIVYIRCLLFTLDLFIFR